MNYLNIKIPTLLIVSLALLCLSCSDKYSDDDFSAFFGGEVIHPNGHYVLFMKNGQVIDTLILDEKNKFQKKLDSLSPGLYTFKHESEYQYVFFDKNDSILVRMNTHDFDESVVFSGRGEEKNNFLIELYLKNYKDQKNTFEAYDYDVNDFMDFIDSSYESRYKFYENKKSEIKWAHTFDLYAKNALILQHYTKKEIYPMMHQLRTGNDISNRLPKNYYAHRFEINFNDQKLTFFSPFVRYLSHMLANISFQKVNQMNINPDEVALETGLIKLNIADTLFKENLVRDRVLNQIAFTFMLEDQNIINHQKFLNRYYQLSTDPTRKEEISNLEKSVQRLVKGSRLPSITFHTFDGKVVESDELFKQKSIIVFWTENAESHLKAIHKKIKEYQSFTTDYDYYVINIDVSHDDWRNHLEKHKCKTLTYLKATDFEKLKQDWAIIKLHRTIILDNQGRINHAFVNLFDANFTNYLN